MKKHITRQCAFVVSLLTLLVATSSLAAQPRQATRKVAPSAAQQQAAQQQAQQPQQLAPPTNEATIRPATSEGDEAGTLPERIDVQSMKRRYWTVGNEDLMDVVQNRLYTKKGRWETALRYGFWSDDPFLNQNTVSVYLGYHLNEFFSLHGFYASVSHSTNQAWDQAVHTGITPDTNPAKSVMGLEGRGSLLYGKLSMLGKQIFYYDFNLAAGFSQHKATVGNSTGFFLGLGQEFFIDKHFFVTLDWRLLFHSDKFPSNTNPTLDRSRSLSTNWIQVGIGAFL